MGELGAFADGFRNTRNIMANAGDEAELLGFLSAAGHEAATFILKGLDQIAATDELAKIGDEYGLDRDAVQEILAKTVAEADELRVKATESYRERPQAGYINGQGEHQAEPEPPPPLPYVDLTAPLVDRAWHTRDMIPMFNVSLVSGEGSVGKSISLMQLSAATVLGKDWFGVLPDFGPVLYLAAEDDDDEIRRRLDAIAAHYQTTRESLHQQGLRVLSYAGRDATLGRLDKFGQIAATPLYSQIHDEAVLLKPKLIVLDTVADCFGGYENDRMQTRQFITLLRRLAIDAQAALIMASHPSVAGARDNTGLSGSTAWHNSVRARLYFKPADDDDKNEEATARVLEIRKNNYGPVMHSIRVIWKAGVFVVPASKTELQKAAISSKAEDVFLALLRKFIEQRLNVGPFAGKSYAPALFADRDEAKNAKLKPPDLKSAMDRLLDAGRILILESGPPSRRRTRLAIAGQPTNDTTNANETVYQRPTNTANEGLPTPPATTPLTGGWVARGGAWIPPSLEDGRDIPPWEPDGWEPDGSA